MPYNHNSNGMAVVHDGDANGEEEEVKDTRVAETLVEDALALPAQGNRQAIRNLDVLKHIISTVAGKDKLVKIIKNLLDLFKLVLLKASTKIIQNDPEIVRYYTKVFPHNRNWRLLMAHPLNLLKILLISTFKTFEQKITFINSQLGLFRYILRFDLSVSGIVPFVRKIYNICRCQNNGTGEKLLLINESLFQDFLNIYYSIFDQLDLFYKLKLWSNESFYSVVAKHEAISWQLDILLGLKNNYFKLQSLERKQLELEIQSKIKKQALQLYNKSNNSSPSPSPEMELDIQNQMSQMNFDIRLVKLDLTRLIFDLSANTTDVLDIKVPSGTYNVLSLSSGIIGFIKIWINTTKELST